MNDDASTLPIGYFQRTGSNKSTAGLMVLDVVDLCRLP